VETCPLTNGAGLDKRLFDVQLTASGENAESSSTTPPSLVNITKVANLLIASPKFDIRILKPRRKTKLEVQEGDRRIKVIFEGDFDPKALSLFLNNLNVLLTSSEQRRERLPTLFEEILRIVKERFSVGFFSSSDVHSVLREILPVEVKLSVVSTYLMRMADRGLLERKRGARSWLYSLPLGEKRLTAVETPEFGESSF